MKTKRLDLESQPTLPPHLTLTIVNEKEVGYNAEAQKIRLDDIETHLPTLVSRLQMAVSKENTLVAGDELFEEVRDFVGRNLGPEDTDPNSKLVTMLVQKLGDHLDGDTSAGVVVIWLVLQLSGDLLSLPRWSGKITKLLLSGCDVYILLDAIKDAKRGLLFPSWPGEVWKRIQLDMLQQYAMDRVFWANCLGVMARGWMRIMVKMSNLRIVLPWELADTYYN